MFCISAAYLKLYLVLYQLHFKMHAACLREQSAAISDFRVSESLRLPHPHGTRKDQ